MKRSTACDGQEGRATSEEEGWRVRFNAWRLSARRLRSTPPSAIPVSRKMGCFGDSESGHGIRDVAILSVALAVSLALLIVAGVTGGRNWLPMLNLGAVVLVPMAVILSEVMAGNLTRESRSRFDCARIRIRGARMNTFVHERTPRVPRSVGIRRTKGCVGELRVVLPGHHPRVAYRTAAGAVARRT